MFADFALVRPRPAARSARYAFRISAIYVLVSALYILVSDHLAFQLASDAVGLQNLQIGKGFAFVSLSGVLLFFLTRHYLSKLDSQTARIRDAHSLHHDMLSALPNAALLLRSDGCVTNWNDRAREICTGAGGMIGGRPVTSFVAARDRPRMDKAIGEVQTRERTCAVDAALAAADGREIPFRWYLAPLHDSRPEMIGSICIGVDLSDLVEAERKLHDALGDAKYTLRQTISSISLALEKRDPYTAGHQNRVTQLALAIADAAGLDARRREGLQYAALLHDIGKLAVPSDILAKPGRLTAEEFELVKSHVQHGYDILKGIDFPWPIARIVLQHHERVDGSGYPAGLAGDDILLEARILGIADTVEAMSSHRPYRAALGVEAALAEIGTHGGTRYDAALVDATRHVFAAGFRFAEAP